MYPTFTNSSINQDSVSVYSGNSTNTHGSFTYHNGSSSHSRMIPRSNSTSDLFDIPSLSSKKVKKKKIPFVPMPSPDISRADSHFMSSSGSLLSRDRTTNYVTTTGPGQLKHEQRPSISQQHSSPCLQGKPHLQASSYPRGSPSSQGSFYPQGSPHANSIPRSKPVKRLSQPTQQQTSSPTSRSARRVPTHLKNDQSFYLASNKRLNPILEGAQLRRPLTPYQAQRKQMKSSFQFPNGENFTPRNKSSTALPRSNSATSLELSKGKNDLPRSNSMVSFNSKSNSMLNPLPRSQSMNTVGLRNAVVQSLTRTSNSPVTSGSSRSSYNSMKERTSDASTQPSTNNSESALPFVASTRTLKTISNGGGIAPLKPSSVKVPDRNNSQRKAAETEINVQSSGKAKPESKIKRFFKKLFSPSFTQKKSLSEGEDQQRKRKRNVVENACSSTASLPMSEVPAKSRQKLGETHNHSTLPKYDLSPKENPSAVSFAEENEGELERDGQDDEEDYMEELEGDYDEEYDDILMDTDLVFDSLLLKADEKRSSAFLKQRDLEKKLAEMKTTEGDNFARELTNSQKIEDEVDEDLQIDRDLISEFSKLGSMIEKCEQYSTKTAGSTTSLQLPQRSSRRPMLNTKETIRSFYQPSKQRSDFADRLVKRLGQNWATVHIGEPFSSINDQDISNANDKQLRFSGSIYVNDTWSPFEYQRSDKKFIKNRRRMMQLENEGFVEAIKMELNDYKTNEMIVHQESVIYTHLFL